jgi:hypothetical protein
MHDHEAHIAARTRGHGGYANEVLRAQSRRLHFHGDMGDYGAPTASPPAARLVCRRGLEGAVHDACSP